MKRIIDLIIRSFQVDKIEHFLMNAVIVLAFGSTRFLLGSWMAIILGVAAAVFVSLYKEYVVDSFADKSDIVADAFGILLGVSIYIVYLLD